MPLPLLQVLTTLPRLHCPKPPLCKGRWHGEAVTKGLRSRALKIGTYSGEPAEIITFA